MTGMTTGSGNVFADLGLPDADNLLIKADLACEVADIIRSRKLTQKAAGEILGTDQPRVSKLLKGSLYGFSVEEIIGYLAKLGNKVEISYTPTGPAEVGSVSFVKPARLITSMSLTPIRLRPAKRGRSAKAKAKETA